ncbi:hypothetical protein DB41_GL00090 [Neochlamydia sp. TUME1]|uniref:hypothetical protein n=1 Tax=Neochlamydia sp. TUME1 TaxID=1478174 RepID=UPI00057DA099|nr:hypothetical protein [Neochlamydia sp. TUME1]KIC76268.1 hypothetical protein DB41_GL00090 [Neochlamydia sp. TUME1]
MLDKYIKINSYQKFQIALKEKEIFLDETKCIVNHGTLGERVVSRTLSKVRVGLWNTIMDFVLEIFSKAYRKAKLIIKDNLERFAYMARHPQKPCIVLFKKHLETNNLNVEEERQAYKLHRSYSKEQANAELEKLSKPIGFLGHLDRKTSSESSSDVSKDNLANNEVDNKRDDHLFNEAMREKQVANPEPSIYPQNITILTTSHKGNSSLAIFNANLADIEHEKAEVHNEASEEAGDTTLLFTPQEIDSHEFPEIQEEKMDVCQETFIFESSKASILVKQSFASEHSSLEDDAIKAKKMELNHQIDDLLKDIRHLASQLADLDEECTSQLFENQLRIEENAKLWWWAKKSIKEPLKIKEEYEEKMAKIIILKEIKEAEHANLIEQQRKLTSRQPLLFKYAAI